MIPIKNLQKLLPVKGGISNHQPVSMHNVALSHVCKLYIL